MRDDSAGAGLGNGLHDAVRVYREQPQVRQLSAYRGFRHREVVCAGGPSRVARPQGTCDLGVSLLGLKVRGGGQIQQWQSRGFE